MTLHPILSFFSSHQNLSFELQNTHSLVLSLLPSPQPTPCSSFSMQLLNDSINQITILWVLKISLSHFSTLWLLIKDIIPHFLI